MTNARLLCLHIAVTLLKSSEAEIASTVPESWYSANVIKDGNFSPKPISELFSTNIDTFSTANPIIVLPSSTPTPLPKTTLQSSTLQTFPSTLPQISLSSFPTSLQTNVPTAVSLSTTALPPSSFETLSPTPERPSTVQAFTSPPPALPPSPSSFLPLQTNPSTFPPPVQILPFPQQIPPNVQYIICPSCPQPQVRPAIPLQSSLPPSPPAPTVTTTPLRISSVQSLPRASSTLAPCTNSSTGPGYPLIRIRMYSSKGLPPIAYINTPRTTIIRTTTTRRPKRNRKNNYDACVNSCGGGKNPICAAPLATRPVDPDTLKGFPSICHMACFNSFKKIQYEKLVDGRCGRLRTRIRPLDSRDKIKKEELDKNQYQIVGGPQTVIEVAPLN